ncbi:MAG: ureidoglycolate lyase [Aliihoeflea sp.]
MTRRLTAQPLTREAFAPFGDVIDTDWSDRFEINAGMATRFHAIASAETDAAGSVIISLFRGNPYAFPLELKMVERHPLGSQAFMPLTPAPFLVVVCPDGPDGPGEPVPFLTAPGQGVNYRRNVWHAVLTPIGQKQDFVVVDRGGEGKNLEEFHFQEAWEIALPEA